MDRGSFRKWITDSGPVILDGASGTLMQERGMPPGSCPETYAAAHPDLLEDIQRQYYEAGSEIVYTFTFGGTRTKLARHGIGPGDVPEINRTLASVSCRVRDVMRSRYPHRRFLVAGDLAPVGEFLAPAGDMSFDELTDIYREQARALEEGGVDLFVVETMMDLAQTRAAVLAIREVSALPVIASMTFDRGRTLSGNTPESGLVTLGALGADAFGANCSTGPDEMIGTIARLHGFSGLPIIAKPNAGMPAVIAGKTVFPMGPRDFGDAVAKLAGAGADLAGGCCGTTPEHIRELAERIRSGSPAKAGGRSGGSGYAEGGAVPAGTRETGIGEYIASWCKVHRVTEKTVFAKAACGDPADLADAVTDAEAEEPDCILVDFDAFGPAGGERLRAIADALSAAGMSCRTPLGVRTEDSALLEAAAKTYAGRLLYAAPASLSGEISDVVDRYGMLSVPIRL